MIGVGVSDSAKAAPARSGNETVGERSRGASPSEEPYLLGAGDRVQVEVFRLPDYGGEFEVLVSGTLSLPMVGQVFVEGLTLEAAEAAISQAYAARLRRPIVNLRLLSPRPLRIGIAGEVSRPGAYTLEREGTQFPSLVAALEAAGGVTQSADLRQITITRTVELFADRKFAAQHEPAGRRHYLCADSQGF